MQSIATSAGNICASALKSINLYKTRPFQRFRGTGYASRWNRPLLGGWRKHVFSACQADPGVVCSLEVSQITLIVGRQ